MVIDKEFREIDWIFKHKLLILFNSISIFNLSQSTSSTNVVISGSWYNTIMLKVKINNRVKTYLLMYLFLDIILFSTKP